MAHQDNTRYVCGTMRECTIHTVARRHNRVERYAGTGCNTTIGVSLTFTQGGQSAHQGRTLHGERRGLDVSLTLQWVIRGHTKGKWGNIDVSLTLHAGVRRHTGGTDNRLG